MQHIKTLAPAAADLEMRGLQAASEGDDPTELGPFVRAMTARLRQREDYDLVQAWMAVFLRLHGEAAAADRDAAAALREWRAAQAGEAKRLGELMGYCGGVLAFLRSAS